METTIAGRGKTVSAFDIQTNYHEAGPETGKPVILLHGSGPGVSAWTNWKGVIPELSDEFRVLAPDMAGFGFTERKEGLTYDIKLWVKHLVGFMDALGIEKANLVGNSFGGSLTLAASVRHPDRFDRLAVMGTPCGKFAMTPGLRAGWHYTPGIEQMRSVMQHFPHDPSGITDELVEERYQASLIPGAQEGLKNLLPKPEEEGETILNSVPEAMAAQIEHPMLVLHGREDAVIPVELGIRLAHAVPNSQLHMFGNCGHWVQAERKNAFVALLRRHFGGQE